MYMNEFKQWFVRTDFELCTPGMFAKCGWFWQADKSNILSFSLHSQLVCAKRNNLF